MPLIGYLNSASAAAFAHLVPEFHKGLGEADYVEGHNVAIEYRWAEGHNDLLASMAADLVRHQVAVIVTPVSTMQAAGAAIGRQIEVVTATTNSDIDAAFATFAKRHVDAFLISPEALFVARRVQILTLAARHAVPAIYHRRAFAEAGGLMSYGSDLSEQYRQTGVYVGRILKGEKPAEMPVELPTKFEFVINLQTAKTITIKIPSLTPHPPLDHCLLDCPACHTEDGAELALGVCI